MIKVMAESEDVSSGTAVSFNPPVYMQRYDAVLNLSDKQKPKKVADVGCGECKLLRRLKSHWNIESLIGVDIDGELLRAHRRSLQPLIADHLIRRPNPLVVQLFKGSIDERDCRLLGCDLLSCIEVIEHLYESILDKVPAVIFQYLKPTTAIFSTPNADFNCLFPNFSGFRHADHKFEWSRQEFQKWCFKICALYNYEVEFSGVGDPPISHHQLGYCSQIAIFTNLAGGPPVSFTEEPYELIYECIYPYDTDPLTFEQRLSYEAQYLLHLLHRRERNISDNAPLTNGSCLSSTSLVDPHQPLIINLSELLEYPQISRLTSNVQEIREALQQHSDIRLSDDRCYAIFHEEEEDEEEEEEEWEEDPTNVINDDNTNVIIDTYEEDWD